MGGGLKRRRRVIGRRQIRHSLLAPAASENKVNVASIEAGAMKIVAARRNVDDNEWRPMEQAFLGGGPESCSGRGEGRGTGNEGKRGARARLADVT